MKKKISLLVFGFLLGNISLLHAQNDEMTGFHFGPLFNINSVWILNQNTYGEQELEYAPKFGMGFGMEAGYNLTDRIGFQTEIRYQRQGQHYEDVVTINGVSNNVLRKVNLSYLHWPLLFKFMGGNSDTRFYGMVGPEFAFLQSAFIYKKTGESEVNENSKNKFQRVDVGIALGLGADIWLGEKVYLNTGLHFYYGLSDINAPAYRKQYDTNKDGIADVKDKPYDKSTNAFGGFNIGLHYIFSN